MKAEELRQIERELEGWAVRVVSYSLGGRYYCTVENLDPGARIARGSGDTREEAEREALEKAERRLGRTRRRTPS